MSSGHRDGRATIFPWIYLNISKRSFIFEGIRWCPDINLVTLVHRYSYLNSLEIVAGYRKIRSSRNPDQFRCVLEKPGIRYHCGILNIESLEPS